MRSVINWERKLDSGRWREGKEETRRKGKRIPNAREEDRLIVRCAKTP